jgi:putative acetyltransferase
MKVKLRPVFSWDIPEIDGLITNTVRNVCRSDYAPQQIDAWLSKRDIANWESRVVNDYFLIAEANQRIVGFGSLKKGNCIDLLYVHQDYMRQGIATTLYKALEKMSEKFGAGHIESYVSKTARPFFEKSGFAIVHENRNIIDGIEIVNYYMRKAIVKQNRVIP